MSEETTNKASTTFWIIAGALLFWNLLGLAAYVMQVSATPESLASAYNETQVAMLSAIPAWATSATAIATTAGTLGCMLLLLRKAWAVPVFVLSLLGILVQDLYMFVLTDSVAHFGRFPLYLQSAVLVIAVFLIWYSRGAKAKGWLT